MSPPRPPLPPRPRNVPSDPAVASSSNPFNVALVRSSVPSSSFIISVNAKSISLKVSITSMACCWLALRAIPVTFNPEAKGSTAKVLLGSAPGVLPTSIPAFSRFNPSSLFNIATAAPAAINAHPYTGIAAKAAVILAPTPAPAAPTAAPGAIIELAPTMPEMVELNKEASCVASKATAAIAADVTPPAAPLTKLFVAPLAAELAALPELP